MNTTRCPFCCDVIPIGRREASQHFDVCTKKPAMKELTVKTFEDMNELFNQELRNRMIEDGTLTDNTQPEIKQAIDKIQELSSKDMLFATPKELVILSITEAYSLSPLTFTVSTELKHSKSNPFLAKKLIKVITRQGDRYNGYNFEGQIVFSYLVDSVNVCYNTDAP